jgi:hypothetical protein
MWPNASHGQSTMRSGRQEVCDGNDPAAASMAAVAMIGGATVFLGMYW